MSAPITRTDTSSSVCRSPSKVPVRPRRSDTSAGTPTDTKKVFAPVVEVNVVRNNEPKFKSSEEASREAWLHDDDDVRVSAKQRQGMTRGGYDVDGDDDTIDSCSSIHDSCNMSREDHEHEISTRATAPQQRNGPVAPTSHHHQNVRSDGDPLVCNNAASNLHIRVYGDNSVTDTSVDGGCQFAFNTNMYDFVEVSTC